MRKGSTVRFRRPDIFLPNPNDDSAPGAAGGEEIQGTIVGFSDSGDTRCAFAIVEMANGQSVVVLVENLSLIDSGKDATCQ